MRRGRLLRSDYAARMPTPPVVLDTVRRDPGMTATYYANRYFGRDRYMEVLRVLWGDLKFYGQVTIDRVDGPEEPPRWYPVFSLPRRLHRVRPHRPEEEDLSVLQHAPPPPNATHTPEPAVEVEACVQRLVQEMPGRDIQFYIGELPAIMRRDAPLAFRRLREAEIIQREQTPMGTFVWR